MLRSLYFLFYFITILLQKYRDPQVYRFHKFHRFHGFHRFNSSKFIILQFQIHNFTGFAVADPRFSDTHTRHAAKWITDVRWFWLHLTKIALNRFKNHHLADGRFYFAPVRRHLVTPVLHEHPSIRTYRNMAFVKIVLWSCLGAVLGYFAIQEFTVVTESFLIQKLIPAKRKDVFDLLINPDYILKFHPLW